MAQPVSMAGGNAVASVEGVVTERRSVMERDFHYNLTYLMAKMTEHEGAKTMAHASQFVDDNNEGFFSIDGEQAVFPEKIRVNGGYYYPIMTQSLSPKSLNLYVQKYVYTPFHFLPGDNDVEIKDEQNSMSTTPNSKNARALLMFRFIAPA